MSQKRQATTDLNHDNWDKEDEPEIAGTFKCATEKELSNRVIKKARRRIGNSINSSDTGTIAEVDGTKSFTSFSGFVSAPKTNPKPTEGLFSFLGEGKKGNESSVSSSTAETAKASAKASESGNKSIFSFTTNTSTMNSPKASQSKPLFSFGNSTSTSLAPKFSFDPDATLTNKENESTKTKTDMFSNITSDNADKIVGQISKSPLYCANLKNLNKVLIEWLQKHYEMDPLSVFTNVFKEYDNYLKQFDELSKTKEVSKSETKSFSMPISDFKFGSPMDTASTSGAKKTFGISFGIPSAATPSDNIHKTNGEAKKPDTETPTTSAKPLFSFNTPNPMEDNKNKVGSPNNFGASLFPLAPGTSSTAKNLNIFGSSGTTTDNKDKSGLNFSFNGGAKPFSFGNIQPPPPPTLSASEQEDENEEPPKVEFKQVVEDDALYSKKCKVFVKKDNTFIDKGVGTLFLKPVPESTKAQLIVRADTNLGNILLNFVLNEALPTQRTGKNNVLIVCLPTPDIEKPVPILIRVKSMEDADELLKEIEKYKK